MFKVSTQLFAFLIVIAAFALVGLQSFTAPPAFSAMPGTEMAKPSTLVATAAAPPQLERSILGGQPIYVLYATRFEEEVLIRCYPGYEPTVTIRAMGPNPDASDVQQEGVMTCQSSRNN